MTKVSAGKVPARVASAAFLDWLRIVGIGRPTNIEFPGPGEQGAIAGISRWQHTVEQIKPQGDVAHQLFWRPDSHQVARTSRRQKLDSMRRQLLGQTWIFTDAQA